MGRRAGLVGRRRVLDSTALYDAVATMDTVTLIRSAIRGVLAACDLALEAELRGVLARDDDYASAGKPVCDYEDPQAREALIDALAKDAHAILGALDGRELPAAVEQAAAVLATVVGQDLDADADGVFRIAQRVAKDRMISTVDPDARHGRKTSARGFDGYKGHVARGPGQRVDHRHDGHRGERRRGPGGRRAARRGARRRPSDPAGEDEPAASGADSRAAVGLRRLRLRHRAASWTRSSRSARTSCARSRRRSRPPDGSPKTTFQIDLELGTVVCPAGRTAWLREVKDGQVARFGSACRTCPLFARCTTSTDRADRSTSARTSSSSLAVANAKPIRRGRPTTQRPARRSSGRSVI